MPAINQLGAVRARSAAAARRSVWPLSVQRQQPSTAAADYDYHVIESCFFVYRLRYLFIAFLMGRCKGVTGAP